MAVFFVFVEIFNPKFRKEFVEAYKSDGTWVKLFTRAKGYVKTHLLNEIENPNWYITIDYWESYEDQTKFREDFALEFRNLDEKCEKFTLEEIFIANTLSL